MEVCGAARDVYYRFAVSGTFRAGATGTDGRGSIGGGTDFIP